MKKLHIGSGPHYAEGWINLDLNNHPDWDKQPDVLASVYDMPFEDGEIDRAYAGHILEHLVWNELPSALKEIKRVMADGGILCVVGPCIEKALRTKQPEWLIENILKSETDDGTGFGHQWTATTLLTQVALETVFPKDSIQEVSIATIKKPEWPNAAESNPRTGSGMWQCAFLVGT